ncbi:MAG: alpha/beta fold hydrolase [Magnetococcales bacterium]|nr:alpha/beta fold hydrolase [Magnetococcales bacterium]
MNLYRLTTSWWGSMLVLLLACYAIASLYLFLTQEQKVFHPSSVLQQTPQQWGLEFESILLSSDGVPIHGWWIAGASHRPVVLFCHGNSGNMSDPAVADRTKLLHELGLGVLLFDYRGYGTSQGSPSETGSYRDGEAALHFLVHEKKIPVQNILVYGHSLGGGIASWLAVQQPTRGLILEGSFTSIEDMAEERYPYLPVRWLARIHYNNLERMPWLRAPLLLIHSREDEVVAWTHGQRLFAAAREPKTWLEMRGSHNHGLIDSAVAVKQAIASMAGF